MRRPRVVHVVPALFGAGGVFGGAERYALELARAMALRVPTTLISFSDRERRYKVGALGVRALPNWVHVRRFRLDPVNPRLALALARADVIHTHQTPTLMANLARLFGLAAGRPVFTTPLGGGGAWPLRHVMDPNRGCSGYLHISQFSRKIAGQQDEPRARVIGGGVDVERFRPDPTVGKTGEVLYVGRLLPHKGINHLVEAVEPHAPLVLVGRTYRHATAYYDLLRRLSVEKSVRFVDDAGDDALVRCYQGALCVVLPSVYHDVYGQHSAIPELLGQTLLEGMACGLPAICTDVASMPEVVEDGVTGFVVPPNAPGPLGDRIRWLREHSAEAARMGAAARRRVLEHFTWGAVVDRCLAAYSSGNNFSGR